MPTDKMNIALQRMKENGVEVIDSMCYNEDCIFTFAVDVIASHAQKAMDAMRPMFCVGVHLTDDGFAKVYGEIEA